MEFNDSKTSFWNLVKNTTKKVVISFAFMTFWAICIFIFYPDHGKEIGELIMKASVIDFCGAILVVLAFAFINILIIYWLISLIVKIFNKTKDAFREHSSFIYRSFFIIVRVIGFSLFACFLIFLNGLLYNIVFEYDTYKNYFKAGDSSTIVNQSEVKESQEQDYSSKTIDQLLDEVFLEFNKIEIK